MVETGTYITGTVLGPAFFSVPGSAFALTAPAVFLPVALAIAIGIGRVSMMTPARRPSHRRPLLFDVNIP
jgi:hypothetical protein